VLQSDVESIFALWIRLYKFTSITRSTSFYVPYIFDECVRTIGNFNYPLLGYARLIGLDFIFTLTSSDKGSPA